MSVGGIQYTSNLSNSRWVKYLPEYIRAAQFNRVYDALAKPIGQDMSNLYRGTTIRVQFLSDLEPGISAIPELTDVTPDSFRDAYAEVTPTSRYKAIQVSEKLMNSASTNYAAERFELLGKNMAESIDLLAQAEAVSGSIVRRATTRTSLDAGTTTHRLTASAFANAAADLQTFKVPAFVDAGRPMWFAIMHPYAFADLRADTTIVAVAEYQKANILLRYELGELGPFKLIVTPWAKTFWGAGAANGTAVETTLNGAVSALDKSVVVASESNIAVGQRIMIGTHETGDTHYYNNEIVTVTGVNSTTITISGEGANGGKFASRQYLN